MKRILLEQRRWGLPDETFPKNLIRVHAGVVSAVIETFDLHPARMSMLFTNTLKRSITRQFHTRTALRYPAGLENILGGGPAPPVQVKSIGEEGIQLADGLVIPSACIFLDGQVFLWNVPPKPWKDWNEGHFRIFDVVVPKPEILILGTGKSAAQLPPTLRSHLNRAGIQVDVMDTWNACSTYNLLAEEGRRVAAALLPRNGGSWDV